MAESGYIQELRNTLAQTSADNMANQMTTQTSLKAPIQQAVQQEQAGALQSYQNTTPSTETNNSIAYSAYLNRSGSAAEALQSSNTAFDLSALTNKYKQAVNDWTILKSINDNAISEFLSSISASSGSGSGSGSSNSGIVATTPTATQDATVYQEDTPTTSTKTVNKFTDAAFDISNSLLGIASYIPKTVASLVTNETKIIDKAVEQYATKYAGDSSTKATQAAYSTYRALTGNYKLSDEQKEYLQSQLEKVQYGR